MTPTDPRSFEAIYAEELAALNRGAIAVTKEAPYAAVDHLDTPLSAICLSGGGIRSASFALGVLQGLARFDLLKHFDYLSTVSGGGYIGSFLTAWRSHQGNDQIVFKRLNRPEHQDGKEAAEVRGIRAYSNYLTPKLGLLSADTWTDIAIVIRNLLLNWLVFLPFFMAVLLVPHLCRDFIAALQFLEGWHADLLFYAGVLSATGGFTMASYGRRRSRGRWLKNGRFLLLVLAPLIAASMFLTAYAGTIRWQSAPAGLRAAMGWGIGCYYLSSLLASVALAVRAHRDADKPVTLKMAVEAVNKRAESGALKEIVLDLLVWALAGALVGRLVQLGMQYGPSVMLGPGQGADAGVQAFLVVTGISWIMLSVLIGELLFVGLRSYSPRGDMDREWLARSAGWFTAAAVCWSVLAAIGLYGPLAAFGASHQLALELSTLGTAGVSGAVSLVLGNSAKTAASASQIAAKRVSSTDIASIAAVIFAVALGVLVSWLDTLVTAHARGWFLLPVATPHWQIDLGAVLLLFAASLLLSLPINVNRFSLHALYRNRLVRAFLGSARNGLYPEGDRHAAEKIRGADPFTDFADLDNVRLAKMPGGPLLHVVNVTLNIVSTKKLAWQQRKAESFTMTPLACGNPHVGYVATEFYGSKGGGITLGSAMAISGAAVSPNMGSHSSPLLGFLMTLFNLRLGWWLGNPAAADCACREGPRVGLVPLLQELAGQTTDERNWIYLSDGGHFDNLGLYEMIRRRCRVIVVSDAGCDPKCELSDLGDCLRKIYIDLGVSIDFRNLDIQKRCVPPKAGHYAAVADITYPGRCEPGWLIYIKPGYHGTERADVRSYAEAHLDFPHESTAQQWFNESQLESYRALGAHIAELLCNKGDAVKPAATPAALDIATFKTNVEIAAGVRASPAPAPPPAAFSPSGCL